MEKKRVVVVGCGIIGLSTAYHVLQSVPDVQVTIVAENFSPNTTSDVAAGLLWPGFIGPTPEHVIRRWCMKTFDHVVKLFQQTNAPQIGISHLLFYETHKDPDYQHAPVRDVVYGWREMTERELAPYPGSTSGVSVNTYMCEGYLYLPWLMDKFRNAGGIVVQRKIKSLDELYADYDVVVNCTGAASSIVNGDTGTTPARGQVIRVYAPWIKHGISQDGLYVIPGAQYVVLGGTDQHGDWNTTPSAEDTEDILAGCSKLIPSLKDAQIVKIAVGHRPNRKTSPIRLEAETVQHQGRAIPVIHNYGHGGAGISTHWGCAQDATELVRQAIQSTSAKGNEN